MTPGPAVRPPYRGTRLRAVRIPDEIWDAATATAKDLDDNLSEVIRDSLVRYTERAERRSRRSTTTQEK